MKRSEQIYGVFLNPKLDKYCGCRREGEKETDGRREREGERDDCYTWNGSSYVGIRKYPTFQFSPWFPDMLNIVDSKLPVRSEIRSVPTAILDIIH